MVNDVQEVREMLAGQILISVVVGLVAMGASVALSAPILATLVVYPVVCSLTLLLTAVVWNIRDDRERQDDTLFRAQA